MPNEHGATATEYALLLSFIVLVVFVGISAFGVSLNAVINSLATQVSNIF